MGSPAFAVPTLNELIKNGHRVVAVYTKPPKLANRGRKLTKTPVHSFAEEYDIPIHTPSSFKNEDCTKYHADVIVVVAYSLLLPLAVLNSTEFGCINVHPSLLPRWRGASPIQSTILAGDENIGVSLIRMDQGLDSGNILMQRVVPIYKEDNYTTLYDKLAVLSAQMLVELLENINNITEKPQDENLVTYCNKVHRITINAREDVQYIVRQVRALSPHPGVFFHYLDRTIKILRADCQLAAHNYPYGKIVNKKMYLACRNGLLIPQIVQSPGKRSMSIQEFLNGTSINVSC